MTSTTERGYGTAHQAERRRWQQQLAGGRTVQCSCTGHCGKHPTCTAIITNTTPWDLGHTDDRTSWTGPECIPCNRTAGAINSNKPGLTIRNWN